MRSHISPASVLSRCIAGSERPDASGCHPAGFFTVPSPSYYLVYVRRTVYSLMDVNHNGTQLVNGREGYFVLYYVDIWLQHAMYS